MATFCRPTSSCFKVHIKMSKNLFKPWKKSFEWKVLNVTMFFHKSRPWLKKGVNGPETHLMYQNIQITKGKNIKYSKVDQLVIDTNLYHTCSFACPESRSRGHTCRHDTGLAQDNWCHHSWAATGDTRLTTLCSETLARMWHTVPHGRADPLTCTCSSGSMVSSCHWDTQVNM